MSTRMSSESEYSAGSGRFQSKRFPNFLVWARNSQLPMSAFLGTWPPEPCSLAVGEARRGELPFAIALLPCDG
jgi:hypothetical protein